MHGVRVIAVVAILFAGCARNAALEVEVTVPAQPAGGVERFAVVQFETGDAAFEDDWRRTSTYPSVALGTEPQTLLYTVLSEEPDTVVLVKVLFCETPDCSAIADAPDRAPGAWFRLERSLYIGERTRWRMALDPLPTDPPAAAIEIGKCEIEGCITAAGTTTYCRLSGVHYCE